MKKGSMFLYCLLMLVIGLGGSLHGFAAPLLYSSFIGGNYNDFAQDMVIDNSGNILMVGFTESDNFPVTPGAIDTSFNDYLWDGYVMKFSSDYTTLIYATYLGGTSGNSYGYAITVDPSGNAIITGSSHAQEFPITSGGYDTSYNWGGDCYIMKLNPTGGLLASTWFGGDVTDSGDGIVLDHSGNVVVGGTGWVPYTSLAYNTTDVHTFVAKFNASLSSLIFSTGLEDYGQKGLSDLALDSADNIYVTGEVRDWSEEYGNVFVYKLNSTGTALYYSKFFGGESYDYGLGITADNDGNAYVTGFSQSTTFPSTPGAWDNGSTGFSGFIGKIKPDGEFQFLSLLKGVGNSITLDNAKNIYVAGQANSILTTTPGCFQSTYNPYCAFVLKLHSSGSTVLYSSFFGNGFYNNTDINKIILESSTTVWLCGITQAYDHPVTANAFDTSYNGYRDGFLSKLSLNPVPVADFYADNSSGFAPLTIHFYNTTTTGAPATSWAWDFGDGYTSTEQHPTHTYATTGYFNVTLTAYGQYGSSTLCRSDWPGFITVRDTVPVFYALSTVGKIPFTVQFIDISSTYGNPPVAWEWNFGDGSTSNLQNPTHTFTQIGPYNIKLKTTGLYSASSINRNNYIIAFDTTAICFVSNTYSYGTQFIFYLGTDSSYTPFMLSPYNTIGTDTIQVTVYNEKHPNRPSTYLSRWFKLTRTNSTYFGNVSFVYTDEDASDAGINENLLKGWEYDYTNWTTINSTSYTSINTMMIGYVYALPSSDWTAGIFSTTDAPVWKETESCLFE